jgi:hypothetical protein
MFGDNVHEFLAPCIYEGEGEMLGMAFFKSLVKHHGTQFFEPVGKALHAAGIKQIKPWNPMHLWALRGVMVPYAKWTISRSLSRTPSPKLPVNMPGRLREHAEFACTELQKSALETSGTMRKHQLKLADRQCRMSELSLRIQSLIVVLSTSLYASEQSQLVQDAADAFCTSTISQYRGQRPSDREYRSITKLGEAIVEGGFHELANVPAHEVMMQY